MIKKRAGVKKKVVKKKIVPLKKKNVKSSVSKTPVKKPIKPIIPSIPLGKSILKSHETKIPLQNIQKTIPVKITPSTQKPVPHLIPYHRDPNTERILIENFVSLQKVMVNLSVKFDNLSNQISRLLTLFEISAKALAEKGSDSDGNKEIIGKIDNLLEQNKLIARGLTLMHESRTGQTPKQPIQTSVQRTQEIQKSSLLPQQQRVVEQRPMGGPQVSPPKFKPLPKD